MLGLLSGQVGTYTRMHAHTDMDTLIRTTGIRHWLVLSVFPVGIWSWLSIGIDGRKLRSQREWRRRWPCLWFLHAIFANGVDHRFESVSQPS